MQAAQWIELLRKIPLTDHNNIMLSTDNGTEVFVSNILRIEENFCLIRGRLGGSSSGGKLLCLPYDHLIYLGFNTPISEERLTEMFGTLMKSYVAAKPAEEVVEANGEAAAENITDEPKAVDKPAISTVALRERLKARLAEQK